MFAAINEYLAASVSQNVIEGVQEKMRILYFVMLVLASASVHEVSAFAEGIPDPATTGPEQQLVADFEQFCGDTGAQTDAVKVAAEAAGAQPLGSDTAIRPFPMTKIAWGHLAHGQRIVVSAGTFQMPSDNQKPAVDARQCTVMSRVKYDAVLAMIGKWVGVSPTEVKPDSTTYDYRMAGATHLGLDPRDETAYRSALAGGGLWSLVVDVAPNGAVEVSVTRSQQALKPAEP